MLLFDGAMGTYLFSKGAYLKKCFEEVCLTNPGMVLDVHREYIESGAQAIETNTYGANPIKLKGYNLSDKTEIINREAVFLARQAAGEDVYVAGSVGPTGQILAPEGSLSIEDARNAFQAHIGALLWAGVDLILLETFMDRREMALAIQVTRSLDATIPIQAQFTFSRSVFAGEDFYQKEAAEWAHFLQEQPIDAAGVNLMGPSDALDILGILKTHLSKPIAVMPDSGFPKEIDGRQFYLTTPDYFAEYAKLFLDTGVAVIGGCCGTTPAHIEKMAKSVLSFDAGRRRIKSISAVSAAEEKQPVPIESRSNLGRDLKEGHWINMIELVVPSGWDLSAIIGKAKELEAGGIRYVNLPDGPRASARISAMVAAFEIARNTTIEPVLHCATRDKNLIGLQADLFGCESQGLHNLLIVTGDPPKIGKYPDVTGVFDVDSVGLTNMVRRFNSGIGLGGEDLGAQSSFVMGTGVNPAFPVPEKELERAWLKAEAGSEYFVTQPVWDTDRLEHFLEKLSETKIPVILGVWPLASYKNAVFLNTEVPGVSIPKYILARMAAHEDQEAARQDGIAISREILDRVRPLVRGVQVSPPFGNVRTALDIVAC